MIEYLFCRQFFMLFIEKDDWFYSNNLSILGVKLKSDFKL
jgi:hypothetical protein